MRRLLTAALMAVTSCETIPAANSQNPPPATNVDVSPLGHLAIPDDPAVLARTFGFFAD